MQQISFSELAYTHKKKTTRKERFLAEMNDQLPWKHLLQPMVRKYPKPGKGRRPIPARGDVAHLFHATMVWTQ
jgi:IS5 family transposase